MTTQPKPLQGKIALVAGATRGAGRAIAVALGQLGATVWCTGRSTAQHHPPDRPETIEQTAQLVTEAGGTGHWRRVDHLDPSQVQALCQEIAATDQHLDILINDVWGGDALTHWGQPLWQHDLTDGLKLLQNAIHTHLITSHYAIPLMLNRPSALLVEITDGVGLHHRGPLYYDLAKTSTIRIAQNLAIELRQHDITVIAASPGFLRSEAMLDLFNVTPDTWRDAIALDPHFAHSETPHYIGATLAALAADPHKHQLHGQALSSGQLALRYNIHDLDGSQPHFGAHARTTLTQALIQLRDSTPWPPSPIEAHLQDLNPLAVPFAHCILTQLEQLTQDPTPPTDEQLAAFVAQHLTLG